MTQVQLQQLQKHLWNIANDLRGKMGADEFRDYILGFIFYKYLSEKAISFANELLKDEGLAEKYHQLDENNPDHAELIDGIKENSVEEVGYALAPKQLFHTIAERGRQGEFILDELSNTLREIERSTLGAESEDDFANLFEDLDLNSTKLGNNANDRNELVSKVLTHLDNIDFDLSNSESDVLGDAYEYLIGEFASGAGKKAGEFYTPPEVSDLIAELLDPQKGDSICDPACGSGSLLMKCGRKVVANHDSKEYALYGQEAIGSTWSLAKMNMFLHGEDNHKIEWGDTIRNPKLLDKNGDLMLFDIVTANPPFSLDKWGYEQAENDKFDRFRRGLPPKTKGDYAFISHMIETLKPVTGRMGVVVPHGVLFRGSSEGKIREKLINENLLDAVIGLPEKLFYGTGIPAAILIFKKQKSDDSVLFIDASREFKSGKNQNNLTEENIAKIIATYRARASVDKYAYLATLQEVKDNDYNLNIPRYVDTFEEEEEIDLVAVRAEREQLKTQLAELEVQIAKYLEELGYVL